MADETDSANVFAIPDFWRSPKRLKSVPFPEDDVGFFHLDIDAGRSILTLPAPDNSIFKPPPSLHHVAIASPITPSEAGQDSHPDADPGDQDPWLPLPEPTTAAPELRTWESFCLDDASQVARSHNPTFVSEAGPAVFDELLDSGAIPSLLQPDQEYLFLDPNEFASCLLALALGRGSLLFTWDSRRRSFQQTLKRYRLSGYSLEALRGITSICLDCGNNSRFLRNFVENTFAEHISPCRVALANAIDRLLCGIQSRLGVKGMSLRSLIQLQATISPIKDIVEYFKSLVVKLSRCATDEHLLSSLFNASYAAEYESYFLQATVRQVLQVVTKPWAEFVEEWLGLRPETGIPISKNGPGKGFVKVEIRPDFDDPDSEFAGADYYLDEDKMPSFIPDDIARPLFETGRNMRFIWTHHSGHPLAIPQTIKSSNPPSLRWEFKWSEIAQLDQQVQAYEGKLRAAIKNTKSPGSKHVDTSAPVNSLLASASDANFRLHFFGLSEDRIEEQLLASMAELSLPATSSVGDDNNMFADALNSLFGDGSCIDGECLERVAPHWSLLPLLSFGPIVKAQARLVDRECMRLLFDAHQLRDHLRVQRDFQLLGNGLFCSRLSHALFDPELDTAERRTGIALSGGNMGLRLIGRETWPPASSELRLALMDVLADSRELHSDSTSTLPDADPLLGDLSFSVRELSVQEMDKCMDPDSLEALDFLRLSYKPPAPLAPIITPAVLDRYDRVFMLLLRVQRMLFVANQLFRDLGQTSTHGGDAARQRFRFEALHFVSSIATYFFDVGVAVPWRRFETWLDRVHAGVNDDDEATKVGLEDQQLGPQQLRRRHDELLAEIMSALLLRKKQAPVLQLLNDIFTLILRFDKGMRCSSITVDFAALYVEFRNKVEVFVTVCRGLAERSSGRGSDAMEEGPLDQLVMMLDMSGFYSKTR